MKSHTRWLARSVVNLDGMNRMVLCLIAVVVVAAAQLVANRAVALRDGEVLGPDNWSQATDLLPDEILQHYRLGEYRNPVMDVSGSQFMSLALPVEFQAASRQNEGRYALTADNSIVDVQTGAPPRFILGYPFPTIDAADPEAGTKIVWNYFYNNFYGAGEVDALAVLR